MSTRKHDDDMSQKEAAEYLGVDPSMINYYRKKKQLKAEIVGRSVRITRKAIEKFKLKYDKEALESGQAFHVLGTVPCGPAGMAQVFDEPQLIQMSKLIPPGSTRVLRACGRSCTGWGILDNSLVFVRVQSEPEEGRFMVLQTPEGFMLKAYYGGQFYSFRKGTTPQVVKVDEATLWGVVLHVMSEPHFEMKSSFDRRNGTNNS